MFVKQSRIGVTVYLYYNRDLRKIDHFGDLVYSSRRFRYAILYIAEEKLAETISQLNQMKAVKSVVLSELQSMPISFAGILNQENS